MATFIWQRRVPLALAVSAVFAIFLAVMQVPSTATSGGSPYEAPQVVDTNPDPNIVETDITAMGATVDLGTGVMASALTFNGQLPGPEFRLKVGDKVIVHFVNNAGHPTGIHWHGIELHNASDGTPLTQDLVPANGGTFLYEFTVTRPGIYWYHPHHHSSTNQVFKGMYGSIIVTDPNEAQLQTDGILPPQNQTLTMVLSDATICKAPGSNDMETYNVATQPWLDGGSGPLPPQAGPDPDDLCDITPIDEDGVARPDFAAGDIPNIQTAQSAGGTPVVEGQTVLTNGKNVGPRSGTITNGDAIPLDPAPAGIQARNVQPGQGLRLQLLNTATTRFFRLRLTDGAGTLIPLVRIGGQAGLLDEAIVEGGIVGGFDTKYTLGEILLDPGDRQDVVAAIPATATGVLTLWTLDFDRTGGGESKIPTVPVAHFNVTGAVVSPAFTIADGTDLRLHTGNPVEVLGAADGSLLDPSTFSTPLLGTPNQDIVLSNQIAGGPAGSKLGINDVVGLHDFVGAFQDFPHSDSSRYANVGDILELTTTNATTAHHPFHLHGFSIQPIQLFNASDPMAPTYTFPRHEFRDNIDIPKSYTLKYRVRIDDRPLPNGNPGGALGRWVFHCHIFFHAVFGMISELVVVSQPKVTVDDAAGNEGAAIPVHATATDLDGDPLTTAWSYAPGAGVDPGAVCTFASPSALDTTVTCTDDGTYTITMTADDGDSAVSADGTLIVANVPPHVVITSPPGGSLYIVNSLVQVSATITDPAINDTLTCTFDWDSLDPDTVVVPVAGSCSASNLFTAAGVYTINVTGADDDGGTHTVSVLVVVFDPDAGFVTGGVNFDSPPGAYAADPTLTGNANVSVGAKYQNKATATTPPDGNTQFQFHAPNLNFHSESLEWLVITEFKAMYLGVGRVNGSGDYGFLLTAYDGQAPGGGGADKIRIKIWDKSAGNAVIYDNRPGLPDDIDTADPQITTGGNIVIHKGK